MGMTRNQLALVRYVAENNIQKAKDAALCCCTEDTTQKSHRFCISTMTEDIKVLGKQ